MWGSAAALPRGGVTAPALRAPEEVVAVLQASAPFAGLVRLTVGATPGGGGGGGGGDADPPGAVALARARLPPGAPAADGGELDAGEAERLAARARALALARRLRERVPEVRDWTVATPPGGAGGGGSPDGTASVQLLCPKV
jgi:hypothetical protein